MQLEESEELDKLLKTIFPHCISVGMYPLTKSRIFDVMKSFTQFGEMKEYYQCLLESQHHKVLSLYDQYILVHRFVIKSSTYGKEIVDVLNKKTVFISTDNNTIKVVYTMLKERITKDGPGVKLN